MRGWRRALFLGVPCAWVALAHVGPLLAMAHISLLDAYPAMPGVSPAYDGAAYGAFWAQPGARASLLRSLGLAAAATGIALVLAYPLAYHVARHVPPARRGRRLALLVAPFWTSEVLRLFALVLLLANRGALNAALRWLGGGVAGAPARLLYGEGAVVAGLVYVVFLSMLLPLYAALDRLPREVTEAAALDGAGPWARLRHVVLPLTARGVGVGCVLTFLACLGVFTAPALLGGAGTPVFATLIADQFAAASGRWPVGAAFGFVLLASGAAVAGMITAAIGRATPGAA